MFLKLLAQFTIADQVQARLGENGVNPRERINKIYMSLDGRQLGDAPNLNLIFVPP
jgi:hypothetical protein